MGTKRIGWARIRSLINENANALQMRKQVVLSATTTTLTAADSGKIIFFDPSAATTILTLPPAEAGLVYKVILKDTAHTDDDCKITVTAGDALYGLVNLTSTGAEHKLANQAVDYDTATGSPASYDFIDLSPDSANTGGTSGDVIIFTAVDDKAWHVQASLTTTNVAPTSVSTIGAS